MRAEDTVRIGPVPDRDTNRLAIARVYTAALHGGLAFITNASTLVNDMPRKLPCLNIVFANCAERTEKNTGVQPMRSLTSTKNHITSEHVCAVISATLT